MEERKKENFGGKRRRKTTLSVPRHHKKEGDRGGDTVGGRRKVGRESIYFEGEGAITRKERGIRERGKEGKGSNTSVTGSVLQYREQPGRLRLRLMAYA